MRSKPIPKSGRGRRWEMGTPGMTPLQRPGRVGRHGGQLLLRSGESVLEGLGSWEGRGEQDRLGGDCPERAGCALLCSCFFNDMLSFDYIVGFKLLKIFFLIYWSIADLQCFVSFWCIAKWFSYICYIFFRLFSIIGYYKIFDIVPCITDLRWSSALCTAVCIRKLQTPGLSLPPLSPSGPHVYFLSRWVCYWFCR